LLAGPESNVSAAQKSLSISHELNLCSNQHCYCAPIDLFSWLLYFAIDYALIYQPDIFTVQSKFL